MNLYRSTNWYKQRITPLLIVLLGFLSCERTVQEKVLINTSMGEIELEIYPGLAPVSANNFLSLVDAGTYEGAIFYRVIRMDNQAKNKVKIEVIQGGLFDDSLVDEYPPIEHETTAIVVLNSCSRELGLARVVNLLVLLVHGRSLSLVGLRWLEACNHIGSFSQQWDGTQMFHISQLQL